MTEKNHHLGLLKLSSADTFDLDKAKILSHGKGLKRDFESVFFYLKIHLDGKH